MSEEKDELKKENERTKLLKQEQNSSCKQLSEQVTQLEQSFGEKEAAFKQLSETKEALDQKVPRVRSSCSGQKEGTCRWRGASNSNGNPAQRTAV